MPQGLQVFTSGGQLILDVTDRLTRIIGQVSTGTTPGSISVPNWTSFGTPWVFIQQRNTATGINARRTCRATISGNTLSWTFEGLSEWQAEPAVIQYGVY